MMSSSALDHLEERLTEGEPVEDDVNKGFDNVESTELTKNNEISVMSLADRLQNSWT